MNNHTAKLLYFLKIREQTVGLNCFDPWPFLSQNQSKIQLPEWRTRLLQFCYKIPLLNIRLFQMARSM